MENTSEKVTQVDNITFTEDKNIVTIYANGICFAQSTDEVLIDFSMVEPKPNDDGVVANEYGQYSGFTRKIKARIALSKTAADFLYLALSQNREQK